MKFRKFLRGQFFVKTIGMESLHETSERFLHHDKVAITFYRRGRWSIFGWRNFKDTTYVRRFVPARVSRILKKSDGVPYLRLHRATHWYVQYHFEGSLFKTNSNIITLAYLLWVLYLLMGGK